MGLVDNIYLPRKEIYISSLSKFTWTTSSSDQLFKTFAMIFSKIMHDEFEMNMMGELNFFFGLQSKQLEYDIFFNQSKYIKKMLKKFGLEGSKQIKTPMLSETKLTRDEDGESVDDTKYRDMIRSLFYLTASWPNIMFSVCLCARFQQDPKTSYLETIKMIFRYISGTTHLGLWYPKGTGVETIAYTNSDHAGDYVDRKSISGVCTFTGCASHRGSPRNKPLWPFPPPKPNTSLSKKLANKLCG
ncbi:retrovirus-related pol polyprotein from transposon TNT 1-94 [Tanacetum coccineum]